MPRLQFPIPVLKQAASALLAGPETTRAEQRKGKPSKLTALRRLCDADPALRKRVIDFCRERMAERARAAAGFALQPTEPTQFQKTWRAVMELEIKERGSSTITEQWLAANPHGPFGDQV